MKTDFVRTLFFIFEPLRIRNFAIFLSVQSLSLIGTWLQIMSFTDQITRKIRIAALQMGSGKRAVSGRRGREPIENFRKLGFT